MKKAPLLAVALLLVCAANPARASVQPADVMLGVKAPVELGPVSNPRGHDPGVGIEETIIDGPEGNGENPTRPVPEPGTMAMASMGLLALGAAIKKKRGR
jgi:hypothetical protein